MIEIDRTVLCDFAQASAREWLETNGIGGYASSSVAGANTRRYHGLLIAAVTPPVGRAVLLSKFEETLTVDGLSYELSANQYPGTVYPQGFRYLTGFRLDPFPIWMYEAGGIRIERRLFMVHGENTTILRWTIVNRPKDSGEIALEIKPLVAFRDHHHLLREDPGFNGAFETGDGVVSVRPYRQWPRLFFSHSDAQVARAGDWYRNFEYAIEQERGFDYHEDLYQPFSLTFDMAVPAVVIASTGSPDAAEADDLERAEIKRRAKLVAVAGGDPFSNQLALAADQFIVKRGDGNTVIAGYPWFSDWGRDTMIALPGLTLATGRPDIAKGIITEFAKHISEGMLPNRFPDAGEEPEYNTVDATLWYFEAIRAYVESTGDVELVKDLLFDKLAEIIAWHVRGTRYGIRVDTDGLLHAGEPDVQLTWMDAKIGDWVVTPRTGKPVEIQALWYNALRVMGSFAADLGLDSRRNEYTKMAEIARESFNGQFWNAAAGCLYDVVNGNGKDAAIRPNQILAVSLPHTMLSDEKAAMVVAKVEAELLTPVGLRSLSPNDAAYVKQYIGSPLERDSAYHQGTVWGWLIGPFIDAYRRVHGESEETDARIGEMLEGFKTHFNEAMVGQISEIFDPEPPFAPRGCPAQAWSVAEVLRVSRSRVG